MPSSDSRSLVAILAAALIWAGVSLVRKPGDAARGIRHWASRRWMREEDVPAWSRDETRYAWGARALGRWLIGLGLLVLALLAATLC